jgi:predicted cupin superfamily sugar epimerase
MPTDRRRTEQAHGALVRQLALTAHPEGGHYRETARLPAGADGRSRMTAILFLLNAGEQSHWHRVDADELWLWHAGSPLTLRIGTGQAVLGCDVLAGEQVQALVPAGTWQSARADSGWALVSCVVSPGFEFDGFELAPPDWSPELP